MPLYEMFCIASHNPISPAYLRQLVDGVSRTVHTSGGVVRDLKNMGIGLALTKRTKRHQQYHTRGDHFLMTFDVSPMTLNQLNEQLRRDPMVIKWTFLKKSQGLRNILPEQHPSIDFDEFASREGAGKPLF